MEAKKKDSIRMGNGLLRHLLGADAPAKVLVCLSYAIYSNHDDYEFGKIYGENMKTTMLPELPDAKSPAGADIRFIMDGETGNMIHGTVPPHQINKATVHATVNEFWYVLEGHGEIWRDDGVESCITVLVPGTSIDIPAGTAFQYRNVSDVDLKFICIAMPPWPGDSEATFVKGIWQPTT